MPPNSKMKGNNNPNDSNVTKSPFFRPSIGLNRHAPRYVVIQEATPRGRHVYSRNVVATKQQQKEERQQLEIDRINEHKSTILGATANVVTAIVGCGIVGIPYAVKQSGFVAGILLILFSALLTEKSLRLLINTAKHVHVGTYETVMEVAFGMNGFRFAAINMFIVAYGGMVSYLMIIKDTFSSVLGVDASNVEVRRSILLVISCTIILPLSCQRDMADLAFTSRISVIIDIALVALIMYVAPKLVETQILEQGDHSSDSALSFWDALYELLRTDIINMDTLFVGLGVLSFAFVCQHSAFIIAGSLDRPTVQRWSYVTLSAVTVCCILAMVCGVSGYIGYRDETAGNILMNLDANSKIASVARLALGISMLFVYPLDSFVVRHVCVVLLFAGRVAHDGDDAAILNRRDRRVILTLALYILAVVPAALFENLGTVLAITGAIGGSCLSYIGPGALYIGIHGDEFIELANTTFWGKSDKDDGDNNKSNGNDVKQNEAETLRAIESTPLKPKTSAMDDGDERSDRLTVRKMSFVALSIRTIGWYITGMPIWCYIATIGNGGLQSHVNDMALKSPHPIRIGDVIYKRVMVVDSNNTAAPNTATATNTMLPPNRRMNKADIDDDDCDEEDPLTEKKSSNARLAGSNTGSFAPDIVAPKFLDGGKSSGPVGDINQQIGKTLLDQRNQQQQQQKISNTEMIDLESDPQEATPEWSDFVIAIFYTVFGVIAMTAGLVSLFYSEQ